MTVGGPSTDSHCAKAMLPDLDPCQWCDGLIDAKLACIHASVPAWPSPVIITVPVVCGRLEEHADNILVFWWLPRAHAGAMLCAAPLCPQFVGCGLHEMVLFFVQSGHPPLHLCCPAGSVLCPHGRAPGFVWGSGECEVQWLSSCICSWKL
jgi:hypothetical protein